MSDDELNLSSGRWIRREVLVEDMLDGYADEDDVDSERMDRILDEMIADDDILRTMDWNGEQYIQVQSALAAFSYAGRKNPSQLPSLMRDTFIN